MIHAPFNSVFVVFISGENLLVHSASGGLNLSRRAKIHNFNFHAQRCKRPLRQIQHFAVTVVYCEDAGDQPPNAAANRVAQPETQPLNGEKKDNIISDLYRDIHCVCNTIACVALSFHEAQASINAELEVG